jgi:hypothetical protein
MNCLCWWRGELFLGRFGVGFFCAVFCLYLLCIGSTFEVGFYRFLRPLSLYCFLVSKSVNTDRPPL